MEVIVVSCRESHIWNGAVIEKYFGYVSVVREKPDQFCSGLTIILRIMKSTWTFLPIFSYRTDIDLQPISMRVMRFE